MGFFLFSGMPAPAIVPEASLPSYAVTLTAYNAVPAQTDGNPLETASGAFSNPEVVAARSRDLADTLPFGTIIELDGSDALNASCGYSVVHPVIGYRVIADTMNARFTKRVDVLLTTKADYTTTDKGMKNAAQVLGICNGVTIRVVGHIDIKHMPKTQAELSRIVRGVELALK
ncbi:MAG: hypothetical protein NUV60_03485 [Patescibacteria group bacterium]|nr:hypothetical protein [Patescibacteria group bacterium]